MRLLSQFGLRNMETRARLLGGSFDLQSVPDQGRTVSVRLPLTSDLVEATATGD